MYIRKVMDLLDFFPAIVQILEHDTKLPNTHTAGATDATFLLHAMCNFDFVVAIVIVHMCLEQHWLCNG